MNSPPALRSLYTYISGSCNLNCRHCWIDPDPETGDPSPGEFLPVELFRKVVLEALPLGLRSVKVTGGEPLLHPGFGEICRFLAGLELEVVLETNAALLDGAAAEQIAAAGKPVMAAVSFDGASPETHDGFRRSPGSFHGAVRGTGYLVDAGVRPQMISTLHSGNLGEVENLVALAEEIGCSSLKLNIIARSGRAAQMDSREIPSIREVLEVDRRIEEEIIPRCGIPVLLGVPMAFHSPARLLRREAVKCDLRHIAGILPGGELALCGIGSCIPDLVYGNVRAESLSDVWSGSDGLSLLRETVPGKLEGVCSGCIHRDVCQGFCIAMNYLETGRLGSACSFCSEADSLGLFPETRKS
jgi:SynChlorMet cassette radical SAM/SPASM protein ScmF